MSRPLPRHRPEPLPSRRRRYALVTLVVVLVLAIATAIVAAGGGDDSSRAAAPLPDRPSPSVTRESGAATDDGRVPLRPGATFGSTLYALSRAKLDRALDDVAALHLRWIRIDLPWSAVQPVSRKRHDWRSIDRVVTAARARKLEVLGLLTYTPAWARAKGCRSFVCPPKDPAAFGTFAADAVHRYSSRGVTTYQVWNEPNLDQFWRSPDPVAYGRLLGAAVRAMRSERTGLRILFGGLAYTVDSPAARRRGDLVAAPFVRRACATRTCDVDAVGYDAFTYGRLPSDTSRPLNAWQQMAPSAGRLSLRSAMAAVGLGRRPVWVTSFGAPTASDGNADPTMVSDRKQAQILRDGVRLAADAPGTIGGFFVNTLLDNPDRSALGARFGLVRTDGTRKPAFAVLQRELRPTS